MPHFPSFEHWFPPSPPPKRRPSPAYTLRHPTEEDLAALDGREAGRFELAPKVTVIE